MISTQVVTPGGPTPKPKVDVEWYLAQQILPNWALFETPRGLIGGLPKLLPLVPEQVVRGAVWQLVTYLFLHGGLWHFVFNMFGLVIFGSNLERYWGAQGCVLLQPQDLMMGAPSFVKPIQLDELHLNIDWPEGTEPQQG